MKVSVGDFELNCEVEGKEGAPWITFGHALGNNLTLWDDQVALLGQRFRILRYDQRGHGLSDAPPAPYSFDELMRDAVELLDWFEDNLHASFKPGSTFLKFRIGKTLDSPFASLNIYSLLQIGQSSFSPGFSNVRLCINM